MCCLYFLLQTTTRRVLFVSIVLALCISSTDGNCVLGEYDQRISACRCNVICSLYSNNDFKVCTNRTCTRTNPRSGCAGTNLCREFSHQCIINETIQEIVQLPSTVNSSQQVCRSILYETGSHHSKERFCKRDYCSNNGICIENRNGKSKRCVCDNLHTGERCETVLSPNSVSQTPTHERHAGKSARRNSLSSASVSVSSTPITVLLFASPCMIIGFIFMKRQRRLSELTPITRTVDTETETKELTSDQNTATTTACKLLNNRHDYDDYVQKFSSNNNHSEETVLRNSEETHFKDTVVTLYNDNDYLKSIIS